MLLTKPLNTVRLYAVWVPSLWQGAVSWALSGLFCVQPKGSACTEYP